MAQSHEACQLWRGHPSALVLSEIGSRGGFGIGRGQHLTLRELSQRAAGPGKGDRVDRGGSLPSTTVASRCGGSLNVS